MLVATENAAYLLSNAPGEPDAETVIKRDGITRVAEGHHNFVAAVEEGPVIIMDRERRRELAVQVPEPVESLLILDEEPLDLLVGTVGAHLYRIDAPTASATRVESFDTLSCRSEWHTPWGGPPAVRSMADGGEGWLYADIHVGSIMRSPDAGGSWEPVTPELNEDVHQVNTSPAAPERIYANTARAVYISDDRGDSWTHRADDLDERYGRAIAAHPQDPDLALASVSDGPHGDNVHAGLYRTEDAGRNWTHITEGFPASLPENINTFRVAFTADGLAWAAAGRSLHVGVGQARRWQEWWQAPEKIIMVSRRP